MGASCSEADIFRVTKAGVEWTGKGPSKRSPLKLVLKQKKTWSEIGKFPSFNGILWFIKGFAICPFFWEGVKHHARGLEMMAINESWSIV